MPENKRLKIEENEKIIDIVERILGLKSENQLGLGLKMLTPNQMLNRLPISLAQLKAGNNSEKTFVFFVHIYCILCTDQKNLQKMFIKVWLTLFKNGSNLYEH